ncbi:hypothetical protein ABGB12_02325 [Actinocorallia sp. B10E7]|uniref:hypothetical protein n=1 Tax=Actinocorallia sp. B10E7 TaxID=3153558 RepID=UPI00325C9718
MHQPYRDPARTFTRRLLLGCLLLAAVFLLLALGAWLKSFTASRPQPPDARPAAPPPVTVTVTVTRTPVDPTGRSGREPSEKPTDPAAPLPPGTDGAAQTACSALIQATALRQTGHRAEAAVQSRAAEEAALSSSVPALRALKGRPAKEIAGRLRTWCPRHFPGLKPKPYPSSPPPASLRPRPPRSPVIAPVRHPFDSYVRGPGPGRPDLDEQDSGLSCAHR